MAKQCSTDEMRFKFHELDEVNRALGTLRRFGISEVDEAYRTLYRARGELLGRLGLKAPKATTLIKMLVGLSPGTINLWHDSDFGWFTDARAKPGAPPVYKRVSDQVAVAILKGELTHALEAELMLPDEYLGE